MNEKHWYVLMKEEGRKLEKQKRFKVEPVQKFKSIYTLMARGASRQVGQRYQTTSNRKFEKWQCHTCTVILLEILGPLGVSGPPLRMCLAPAHMHAQERERGWALL